MDNMVIAIYIFLAVVFFGNIIIFWGMASNVNLMRKELIQIKEELRIQSIKNERNINAPYMYQMENMAEVNSYNRKY